MVDNPSVYGSHDVIYVGLLSEGLPYVGLDSICVNHLYKYLWNLYSSILFDPLISFENGFMLSFDYS